MHNIKISTRRSLLFLIIATAIFTIFSISALWVYSEINRSKQTLREISESYELEQRELLKSEVKKIVSLINFSQKYNKGKTTKELQNEMLDYVSSIRLNHGGYIFINTYSGRALIFDGVKIIGEKDIRNITDPDGLKIFEVELNTINSSDGGFFRYKFKRLDTFNPVPKLSYVIGYNDWEWIIGSGIYLDDLSISVQNEKNQLQATLFKKVLYIVVLFFVLLMGLIGVAIYLSNFIRKEFEVIMSFLNNNSDNNSLIDPEKLNIVEFKELAHSANTMIKQRRLTEELLKKERDKVHRYLNITGVLILVLDTKGNVKLINKKGCETLGYNEEDIIGKNWFSNFVPLADKQRLSTNYSKVISGNSSLNYYNDESNIITRLGQERIISWQNTLLIDENETITGILVSGQDITENRLVEDSYSESEEKYKLLFEKTNDPVLIIGRSNTFINCNEAAAKILGLVDKDELTGTHPDKISPVKQDDGSLSIIKASEMIAKARREGFHSFEWLHVDKNKKPFYVDVSLTVIPISGIEYLYVVWRDISEKKKQYQELVVAKEKAEQSDIIKTSFLRNIQHEIRTPLNAIMGFSQLLKQPGIDNEEAQGYYEDIISSGNQLTKIIDEIIDFSRLQTGSFQITSEATELKKLVIEIFKEYYPTSLNKSVKFTINTCPSNNNTVVKTDVPRLKQILGYLVENAFKFTKKGLVEIGYTISTENITFHVTDTGVGIEEKNFETIFEEFNRLIQKDPEKLYGGTGLGLSISKSILDYLGGKIWVESEVGGGSKFSFTIPYLPVDIVNEIGENLLKGNKISIVTSDEERFMTIANALSDSGARIIQYSTGIEAIESCQADCKTDLMIIDIGLPDMIGITTTIAIKAIKKDFPVIALISKEPLNLSKEDALLSGCDDYITLDQTNWAIILTLYLYLNSDILDYPQPG